MLPSLKAMTQVLRLLAAALLLSGCAALQRPPSLPSGVQQALTVSGLPQDALAYIAIPLHQRGQALRLRDQQAMQPASTMKLVTTIVALDRLGPNARGRTELLAAEAQLGDVLTGPLYLRGGADTDLDWGVLNTLLRQLREQGVREIRGGLVVDRSLFKPARMDVGVPPFDEQPEFQYNQIPDALQLNVNLLDVLMQSDASSVQARVFPTWPGIGTAWPPTRRTAWTCPSRTITTRPDSRSSVAICGPMATSAKSALISIRCPATSSTVTTPSAAVLDRSGRRRKRLAHG